MSDTDHALPDQQATPALPIRHGEPTVEMPVLHREPTIEMPVATRADARDTPPEEERPVAVEEGPDAHADTLDLDQAATYAGRTPATLRRVVRQGKLPRQYRPGLDGPELIFTRATIDAWLADQARAVATRPTMPVSAGRESDAAATHDAARADATAIPSGDTRGTATRLYALVALAYAQRLQAVDEQQQQQAQHLAAVEARARAAADAQLMQAATLAGVRARLAQLEADQDARAGVAAPPPPPHDTQERRAGDRRAPDTVWIAQERRRFDRRAQQDRARFEEHVMGPYVPPVPTAVPPPNAAVEKEKHRRLSWPNSISVPVAIVVSPG